MRERVRGLRWQFRRGLDRAGRDSLPVDRGDDDIHDHHDVDDHDDDDGADVDDDHHIGAGSVSARRPVARGGKP